MSTNEWIAVAAALVGGLVVGLVLSRVAHMLLGRPTRPAPIQQAAGPVGSIGFSVGVVGGLLVALGIVQPDAVDQLTTDAVGFIPKALTAAIIVIVANVLSSFATAALGTALARASSHVQTQAIRFTRVAILVMAVLLAVPTLGIDTTVVNLGVAALFFAAAASFTLLVGLGGRSVAEGVASTRAVRRLIRVGDAIELSGGDPISGEVVTVHPTTVEVETASGDVVLVPSARFLAETLTVVRAADGDQPAADGDEAR